jgi:hypothetical protein
MAELHRWTAWNLGPNGWHRSQTVLNATEATRYRPADTLLALMSMYRVDDPHRTPTVTVLFRSPDTDALAEAMSKYGAKPKD